MNDKDKIEFLKNLIFESIDNDDIVFGEECPNEVNSLLKDTDADKCDNTSCNTCRKNSIINFLNDNSENTTEEDCDTCSNFFNTKNCDDCYKYSIDKGKYINKNYKRR